MNRDRASVEKHNWVLILNHDRVPHQAQDWGVPAPGGGPASAAIDTTKAHSRSTIGGANAGPSMPGPPHRQHRLPQSERSPAFPSLSLSHTHPRIERYIPSLSISRCVSSSPGSKRRSCATCARRRASSSRALIVGCWVLIRSPSDPRQLKM
ncbi:hypothetical protein LX32DRAFT_110290 [Colletotrichum zoysiae]|uniref:Uncharacterized protein n=1 Tax=Colletotrichum zoysiae TaxID=1216348 RepID=A0AAD9M045_9PEZI|nr:hypothetical protein LX32DRAFT_110290 [Colletotrichum zoysiae]